MNVVLLITVTLALTLAHTHAHGHGHNHKHNSKPCQDTANKEENNEFVQRHILPEGFDINSKTLWETYLKKEKLCNQEEKLFFFESKDQGAVENICNGKGKQLKGHLCISDSEMLVYDIKVNKNCEFMKVPNWTKNRVVVACDKFDKRCLPAHFEEYTDQKPASNAKVCKP